MSTKQRAFRQSLLTAITLVNVALPYSSLLFGHSVLARSPSATEVNARSSSDKPVSVIANQRLEIETPRGTGIIPLDLTGDWQMPQPKVTRAVIVFHGKLRNADAYLQTAKMTLTDAGQTTGNTLLIVPQFLDHRDIVAHQLPDNFLRWGPTSWMEGDAALDPSPISSFEVIDTILMHLANREIFPHLQQVVLVGHSAGGQLVQRYAVVGREESALQQVGIHVRYVVANPSSYLYFDDQRPTRSGKFVRFNPTKCPNFNSWKYGLADSRPAYVTQASPKSLEQTYASREVIYLLGTADTNPHLPALDKSCAAEAQGPTHLARGLAYMDYMTLRQNKLNQRLMKVPGVGHDDVKMLTSVEGIKALYGSPISASGSSNDH